MPLPRSVLSAALPAAALLLAACGTVQEHRARQFATAFEEFPAAKQETVLHAGIEEGWSPVAVYIALGTPEHAERLDDRTVQWIYWGYRHEPVEITVPPRPVFHTRSETGPAPRGRPVEQMIITFRDDAVTEWTFAPVRREHLHQKRDTPFGRIPEV
ncbi:MAG: hypothetical protein JJU00_13575 [Opitutales bacterium]|nr:hypothetical protein [Opitutales bacterium]